MGTDEQDRQSARLPFLEEKKENLRKWWSKKRDNCLRKKEKTKQDLRLAEQWETTWQEAELLQANFAQIQRGMKEISVADWWRENEYRTIVLDPSQAPLKEVQNRFQLAKKRKKSIPFLQEYLEKLDKQMQRFEWGIQRLGACQTEQELLSLEEEIGRIPTVVEKKQEKKGPALPYRRFVDAHGAEIWVGKTAHDNDTLTFRHARGNDWWFHVAHTPGSHVVVRLKQGQDLDPETKKNAGLLALRYSKAQHQKEAEIVYTQQKWVRKLPGGRPGQVLLAQRKSFFIYLDPDRLKELEKMHKT